MPVPQPSSSLTHLSPMDSHILIDTETETDAGDKSDAGATDSRTLITRTGESDFVFAQSAASIP